MVLRAFGRSELDGRDDIIQVSLRVWYHMGAHALNFDGHWSRMMPISFRAGHVATSFVDLSAVAPPERLVVNTRRGHVAGRDGQLGIDWTHRYQYT